MNRIFNHNRTEHTNLRTEQRNNREATDKPRPVAAAVARLSRSLENMKQSVWNAVLCQTPDKVLIKKNLTINERGVFLDLSEQQLKEMPSPLPDYITCISATNNKFDWVDDKLPRDLKTLHLSYNLIRSVPNGIYSDLRPVDVDLSHNRIHMFPYDYFPGSITTLKINHNNLLKLPNGLPRNLEILDVSNNLLKTLPDTLENLENLRCLYAQNNKLTKLPKLPSKSLIAVNIENNQLQELSDETFELIEKGKRFALHSNPWSGETVERLISLHQANRNNHNLTNELQKIWFDCTGGKAGFSLPFQTALSYRQQLFGRDEAQVEVKVARPTPALTTTIKPKPATAPAVDFSTKHYDKDLEKLIKKARGSFHLEQLKKIAHEQLHKPLDQNELLLGYYQTKLSGQLALPAETSSGADSVSSLFTKKNLDEVKAKLLQADQKEFIDYLSTNFAEWQEAIHTKAPELYEQADKQLIEATNKKLSRRVNKKLQELPNPMRREAEATIQEQVRTELKLEVYEKLTRDFLASKGMLHLLD